MARSGWNWLNALRRTLLQSFSSFAPLQIHTPPASQWELSG